VVALTDEPLANLAKLLDGLGDSPAERALASDVHAALTMVAHEVLAARAAIGSVDGSTGTATSAAAQPAKEQDRSPDRRTGTDVSDAGRDTSCTTSGGAATGGADESER